MLGDAARVEQVPGEEHRSVERATERGGALVRRPARGERRGHRRRATPRAARRWPPGPGSRDPARPGAVSRPGPIPAVAQRSPATGSPSRAAPVTSGAIDARRSGASAVVITSRGHDSGGPSRAVAVEQDRRRPARQAVVGAQGRAQPCHPEPGRRARRHRARGPSRRPGATGRSKSVPKATAPVPAATTAPGRDAARRADEVRDGVAHDDGAPAHRAPRPPCAAPRSRSARKSSPRIDQTTTSGGTAPEAALVASSVASSDRASATSAAHVDAARPDAHAGCGEHGARRHGIRGCRRRPEPPTSTATTAGVVRRLAHASEPITSPCRRSSPPRSAWWRRGRAR